MNCVTRHQEFLTVQANHTSRKLSDGMIFDINLKHVLIFFTEIFNYSPATSSVKFRVAPCRISSLRIPIFPLLAASMSSCMESKLLTKE